jgi:uncharacterized protein (TIGR00730 family)
MNDIKRVCVFCGANPGADPVFVQAARRVGAALARRKLTVVYGGGHTGLMGTVADAALEEQGQVIGVIPHNLEQKELAHRGLTELHVVHSMHERKAMMADLADAFIALPGGIGTLEEMFEIWTWGQLGLHHKPCGLLNVKGYYDALWVFLKGMVEQKFLRPEHWEMMMVDDDPEHLLERFQNYVPPQTHKWIDRERS